MYKVKAGNQLKKKKILRFDHGEKYTTNEMTKYCQEHDIIHTAPCKQQSNGVAERKKQNTHRHDELYISEL